MDDRELDLDALEKVARDSCWPCTPAAGGLFRNTITPATVLKLIALARPKAGGVEAEALFIAAADMLDSQGIARIRVGGVGLDREAVSRHLRLYRASVGWLFQTDDFATEFSTDHPVESGEDPYAKDIRPATAAELLELLKEAWSGLKERDATIRLAAAPEPLRVAGEEVERMLDRLTSYDVVGGYDGSDWESAARDAAAMIRRLALIEPSAGGGEPRKCWVLQRNNNPWATYTNADEARVELASKRASEMRWREENIHVADVRTYWNLFEVPVSPTPDQPKQEVKDV